MGIPGNFTSQVSFNETTHAFQCKVHPPPRKPGDAVIEQVNRAEIEKPAKFQPDGLYIDVVTGEQQEELEKKSLEARKRFTALEKEPDRFSWNEMRTREREAKDITNDLIMRDSKFGQEEDKRIRDLGDKAKNCGRDRRGPQIQLPDDSRHDESPIAGDFIDTVYPGAKGKTRRDLFPTEVEAVPTDPQSNERLQVALAGKSHEAILRNCMEEQPSSESV